MPTIGIRDYELNQTTITGRRNPNVTVEAVHNRLKRDPKTQQPTSELDGVNVDIIAVPNIFDDCFGRNQIGISFKLN